MLDIELSSSLTARFSTRPSDFCRTNLDRHCRFTGNGGGPPDGHEGHDLEYRGTKEVLEVASPPADDAIVPVETRRVDSRTGPWCQEEA